MFSKNMDNNNIWMEKNNILFFCFHKLFPHQVTEIALDRESPYKPLTYCKLWFIKTKQFIPVSGLSHRTDFFNGFPQIKQKIQQLPRFFNLPV